MRMRFAHQPGYKKNNYKLLLILLPFILLTFVFQYIPLFGWYLALIDYKPAIPVFQNEFVGLKHFRYLATDWMQAGAAVKNTVIFAALSYVVSWVPMALAILLNEVRSRKFLRTVQTVTTFPNFISWVIVYSLAFQMFSYEGLVSNVLQQIGLSDAPVSALANDEIAYYFQTLVGLWKSAGWSSIIYLAAISGIDPKLYEAAQVDGANRYQRIWHITLPSLMPTYIVLLLLAIGNFVNIGFEQYFMFRNSITSYKLDVIDVYIYIMGLGNAKYSYATAIGIIKSAITLTLLFLANRLAAKMRGQSII